jgi:hypothetical protein
VSRGPAPGAAPQRAYRIVTHLLGTGRLGSMLMVVGILVGIGWLGDSLFEWFTDLGALIKGQGDTVRDWWPLHRIVGMVVLPLLLGWLWRLAGKAEAQLRPRVIPDRSPEPVPALILYLSAVKSPEELDRLEAALSRLSDPDAFRREFGQSSWRMPIEAIAYHLPALRHVLVISSSRADGNRHQVRTFKSLVARVFPGANLRVRDIADMDSTYEPGLDFNLVHKLADATNDAYARLRGEGLAAKDILIDITGGSKPCTIAGGAVALAEGRRIQYVSSDYKVLVYDVTYDD